jgi:hypothetical protein
MQPATATKTCLACNTLLRGRLDKKFCNDYCRNNYNNKNKATTATEVRTINAHLLKNRQILQSYLPPHISMVKQPSEQLLGQGFLFKYHTHTYTNKKGQVYFFCYEYGYLPLENNWVLIVQHNPL